MDRARDIYWLREVGIDGEVDLIGDTLRNVAILTEDSQCHVAGASTVGVYCPGIPYEPDVASEKHREGEREVRLTIIRLIRDHLQDPDPKPNAPTTWCGHDLDLTNAMFDGGDFTGAKFTSGIVLFDHAKFTTGLVAFKGAKFTAGIASFFDAKFAGPGGVNFQAAEFSGADVRFLHAKFTSGPVNFSGAAFTASEVSILKGRILRG